MGYRIVYGRKRRKLSAGRIPKVIVAVASFLLVAFWAFSGFDRQVNGAALENMAESVRNGESVSEAIVTFCREIIENAKLPQ